MQQVTEEGDVHLSIQAEIVVFGDVQDSVRKPVVGQALAHRSLVVTVRIAFQHPLRVVRIHLAGRANGGSQHFRGVSGVGADIQCGHARFQAQKPKSLVGLARCVSRRVVFVPVWRRHLGFYSGLHGRICV